jgi:putative oxygen-independent coproporphyrinogen III oxidase
MIKISDITTNQSKPIIPISKLEHITAKFQNIQIAPGQNKPSGESNLEVGISLKQLPPLALYIHIPWCVKKCPYCDFNSHNAPNELPESEYIDCLIKDLETALPLIWGRTVYTIFIGGGTPSLFSGNGINRLLIEVRSRINLSPFAEITIEANPGAVDNQNIVAYREAGVNRISFGVQSFNDKYLKSLGRIHDSQAARTAIKIARQHFSQINIDLMYGLPGQTVEELKSDLDIALDFNTSHLSCYNLTIEPNTGFYNKVPKNLPDNDLCYTMQDIILERLDNSGLNRYETSAYAKEKSQCQHNLNYWQYGDYLGIGAGAHSKLSFHNKIIRQARQKHPRGYMTANIANNQHIIENKQVIVAELPFEFMMNALRLIDGVPIRLFVERTDLSLNSILPKLQAACDKGLIQPIHDKIVPTKRGQDFLNDLLLLFL